RCSARSPKILPSCACPSSGVSAIAFVPARRDPRPGRDRAAGKGPGVDENPGAIGVDGRLFNFNKNVGKKNFHIYNILN
ncbi:MAG: hypothetical protein V3S92_08205, partial [Alphaproteobacteria bacterium]